MIKVLAVIPARSGSKGIKNKNIRKFAGKPLLSRVINCAQKSKYVNRIIVSTDSKEYASLAKKFGAEAPFLRPRKLARDKSSVADVVIDLLDKLKKNENYLPDYILLLQPTSPLREAEDIDNVLEFLLRKKGGKVATVCATEQLLYTKSSSGILHLVSDKKFLKSANRQELPKTYRLDGSMVYAVKTTVFLRDRSFVKGKVWGYEIPVWRGVDLDEPEDFVVGEILFKNKKNILKKIKNFK